MKTLHRASAKILETSAVDECGEDEDDDDDEEDDEEDDHEDELRVTRRR